MTPLRIPSAEVDRYLNLTSVLEEQGAPRDGEPHNLQNRVARFEEQSGGAPADFVQAWRSGEIDDNPDNARLAIEALMLRAALEQPGLSG